MAEYVMIAVGILLLAPVYGSQFRRKVEADQIRLVSWMGGTLKVYRGPCRALLVPLVTVTRAIPASTINVDIEITDQTGDVDANRAPVKATLKSSAAVRVGEQDAMAERAANQFFSKPPAEQLSILQDVISSASRRVMNRTTLSPATARTRVMTPNIPSARDSQRVEGDDLATDIQAACSQDLEALGLTCLSFHIKECG